MMIEGKAFPPQCLSRILAAVLRVMPITSDIWLGAGHQRTKPLFWKSSATGSTPAMRDGQWKLHLPRQQRGTPELYDLSTDPSESTNVADANPQVLARLTKHLRAWVAELPETYEKSGEKNSDE